MPILTGFGLKNFRVFKEETFFELAPITVLTGTNSSGKSSVLKALLLLKDNWRKSEWTELDFTGSDHKLGTFQKSVNLFSDIDEITFSFGMDNSKTHRGLGFEAHRIKYEGRLNVELCYKPHVGEKGSINYFRIIDEEGNERVAIYYFKEEVEPSVGVFVDFEWFFGVYMDFLRQSPGIIEGLPELKEEYERNEFLYSEKRMIWIFHGIEGPMTIEEWKEMESLEGGLIDEGLIQREMTGIDARPVINQINLMIQKALSALLLPEFIVSAEDQIFGRKQKFLDFLKAFFEFYTHENDIYEINYFDKLSINELKSIYHPDGEELPSIIGDLMAVKVVKPRVFSFVRSFKDQIFSFLSRLSHVEIRYIESIRAVSERLYLNAGSSFSEFLTEFRNSFQSAEKTRFINKWINIFSLGEELTIESVEGVATDISIIKNGHKHTLADLGYGVTQLLPIILKVSFYHQLIIQGEKDFQRSILLLEEPETNLHPNLQSKLADFFVDAMNTFKVQFIIETHSEYLIRKLQYLTAKKEIKPEDTSIYYFYEPGKVPEGEPQVKKLDILEDGRLSGTFGPGFFDEADSLAIDLFTLQNLKSN